MICETPNFHYDRGFDFEDGYRAAAKEARNFVMGFVADMDWITYVREA